MRRRRAFLGGSSGARRVGLASHSRAPTAQARLRRARARSCLSRLRESDQVRSCGASARSSQDPSSSTERRKASCSAALASTVAETHTLASSRRSVTLVSTSFKRSRLSRRRSTSGSNHVPSVRRGVRSPGRSCRGSTTLQRVPIATRCLRDERGSERRSAAGAGREQGGSRACPLAAGFELSLGFDGRPVDSRRLAASRCKDRAQSREQAGELDERGAGWRSRRHTLRHDELS